MPKQQEHSFLVEFRIKTSRAPSFTIQSKAWLLWEEKHELLYSSLSCLWEEKPNTHNLKDFIILVHILVLGQLTAKRQSLMKGFGGGELLQSWWPGNREWAGPTQGDELCQPAALSDHGTSSCRYSSRLIHWWAEQFHDPCIWSLCEKFGGYLKLNLYTCGYNETFSFLTIALSYFISNELTIMGKNFSNLPQLQISWLS